MRSQLFDIDSEEDASELVLSPTAGVSASAITPSGIVTWSHQNPEQPPMLRASNARNLQRRVDSLGIDLSVLLSENYELRKSYMSILNAARDTAAEEVRLKFARVVLALCFLIAGAAVTLGFILLSGKRLGFALAVGGAIVMYEVIFLFRRIGLRGRPKMSPAEMFSLGEGRS